MQQHIEGFGNFRRDLLFGQKNDCYYSSSLVLLTPWRKQKNIINVRQPRLKERKPTEERKITLN
jgi:hypothetical protein